MLNAFYDFENESFITPYIGGGVGIARYRGQASNITVSPVSSSETFIINGFNDTDTGFAWQLGAGLSAPIGDRFVADLGYRFFNVQDLDFIGQDVFGEELPYTADFEDHSLLFGLRYKVWRPKSATTSASATTSSSATSTTSASAAATSTTSATPYGDARCAAGCCLLNTER